MKTDQSKNYLFSVENEYSVKIVKVNTKSEKLAREIIAEEYSDCNASYIEYKELELEEIYCVYW